MAVPNKRKSKTSLAIVERAYRGSIEEQYGHIVWLSRIMKGMNAPTALLLKGDTVMFAKRQQAHTKLTIGDMQLNVLSHYESGIMDLMAAGVPLYGWHPDLVRLQLTESTMVEGIEWIRDADMPGLISRHDCVWYW